MYEPSVNNKGYNDLFFLSSSQTFPCIVLYQLGRNFHGTQKTYRILHGIDLYIPYNTMMYEILSPLFSVHMSIVLVKAGHLLCPRASLHWSLWVTISPFSCNPCLCPGKSFWHLKSTWNQFAAEWLVFLT